MSDVKHSGPAALKFFERDQFVGELRQYCCGYRGTGGEVRSAYWPNTAFACPTCGNIWGRSVFEFEFDYAPIPPNPWVFEIRRCRDHGDGLFLTGIPDQILREFTTSNLLRREAEILVLRENNRKLLSPLIPPTPTPPAAMSALSRFRRNS